MTIRIARLNESDHDAWLVLARGYRVFYQTGTSVAEYEILAPAAK